MNTRLMFSEEMTYSDYCLARKTEVDIEAELIEAIRTRNSTNTWNEKLIFELKTALRTLDDWKIGGTYDECVEALRKRIPKVEVSLKVSANYIDILGNFLAGLKSPDMDQRAAFLELKDFQNLGEKTPREIWPVIARLEKAKKRNGRPGISPPWRNEVLALESMRISVSQGLNPRSAAFQAAEREGRAEQNSRAEYFAKLFRQRVRLRE